MMTLKLLRCAFTVGLAAVGAAGCAGPVETNDTDLPAEGVAEDVGTTEAPLVQCGPSRAIFNTGFDIGNSQYITINYVAASGSNRIAIQGRSSTGLYKSGYIDLAGFTVSGSWGTMGKPGKITSMEISGKTMKITGQINYVSTSKTLTFAGDISFAFNSISAGPLGTVNRIFPYPTTSTSFGLTMGATYPGPPVSWATSNSTLSCM